ncbi:ABC transporter permease [Siminovitchia sp. 179-K 8D1 HS]|uniref:ABC transporter permease n=1 Tax=Siminovitchia sp. 179-K 8D1 HS TaxID=3142385 RepID=UPI0039A1B722
MTLLKKYGLSILLLLLLLIGWESGARLYGKPFILPSPIQIAERLWELRAVLFIGHLLPTTLIMLIGLLLSLICGVGLSIWMHKSDIVRKAFFPLLIASQTIPIIALAPIFVLWFGYSIWSKVVVTVLITFFPITVNTFDGLRSADPHLKETLQTMRATKRQIFFKVELPSALPQFYSGLKVAVTLSVIGAAIGEWLGADKGLGYFSRRMMTQFDGAGVFAPIVILSVLGITLFLLVGWLEKITLKWRNVK